MRIAIEKCFPSSGNVRDKAYLDAGASGRVLKMISRSSNSGEVNHSPLIPSDDYDLLRFREELLLYYMNQPKIKFISGHFPFSEVAYREFHQHFAFVTILRDPVARWKSSYFFNRYKSDDHVRTNLDLDEYIDSQFSYSQGYELVKFLGGIDQDGDYNSPRAIDRAKRNLDKFSIIGFLENQDAFVREFQERLGMRLKLEKKNPNPASETLKESLLTKEVEEKITQICGPDLEVYRYAQESFSK